MATDLGHTCSSCGEFHADLPVWGQAFENAPVIKAQHFFVKGMIGIPVVGSDEVFGRALDLWDKPGRESEKPCFGRPVAALTIYSPSALNLKTDLRPRKAGLHPRIDAS